MASFSIMKNKTKLITIIVIFVGVLGLVGVLADIGNLYLERDRLEQVIDEAALSTTTFLPFEHEAHEEVLRFLREEGYSHQNWEEVKVVINNEDVTEQISESAKISRPLIIWIDTSFSRLTDVQEPINTANKIRVKIRQEVPTIFLWLFGIKQVSIEDTVQAEQFSNIMMTVVSDIFGSAKLGVLCSYYGRKGDGVVDNWTQCDGRSSQNIYHTVDDAIRATLDDPTNENLTGVVAGMKRSIALFNSASGEYKRSRAIHIMFIITDRTPNVIFEGEIKGQECWRENLWIAESEDKGHREAADCAIYYGKMAAEKNISTYIISMGSQVDKDLMQKITIMDSHYWISSAAKLKEFPYEYILYGTGPRIMGYN